MAVFRIALLLVSFLWADVTAFETDSLIRTFFVQEDERSSYSVGDPDSDQCTFTFSTRTPTESEEKKNTQDPEDFIKTVMENNADLCLQGERSGWHFKVCLGKGIVQTLPGSEVKHSLGEFKNIQKKNGEVIQSYEGGDPSDCGDKARSSAVKFACAATPGVYHVNEPQVCFYELTIGLPEICAHPDFTVLSTSNSGTTEQPWLLELVKFEGSGAVQCTARHSGYGNWDERAFATASLVLKTTGEGTLETEAREHDRAVIPAKSLSPVEGGFELLNTRLQFLRVTKRTK
eukprot:TRINITY_DN827_c0_g1_i1.p1 TRINITY_DN827_c0_g1~~TRINITY_DN827_c0_g1_i1.p1  ORF type:complete len:306 (-),score=34.82 TRINITY_DN827_c0_g1_i1:1558-2424(-)